MKLPRLLSRKTFFYLTLVCFSFSLISPAAADVGLNVNTSLDASYQNIIRGNAGSATTAGNLMLLQNNNADRLRVDLNGNVTVFGRINGLSINSQAVGFTINGGTTPYTLTVTGNATISGNPLVSPMTTLGDVMYGAAGGAVTRLAGAAGFLKSTGAAAPAWSAVTASDVGLGNVENTKLSTWAGSANITTVGTIGTGTWNATTIGINKGGTGLTAVGTNGQVLSSNGTAMVWTTPATGMANPMTTAGDIIYGGAAGAATRLAGAAGILHSTGAAAPTWGKVSLTADVSGTLPAANGGTGNVNGTVASLTANGSNCAAGNYPLGVDASGNAESCTAAPAGVSGGTASYVARFTSATALSTGAIYDNGTYVGIGTTVPGTSKLNVQDSSQSDTAITAVSGTGLHVTSNRNASGGVSILSDCAGGDSSNCDYAINARGGWQAAVSGYTTANNSSGAGIKGYSQYGSGVSGSGPAGVYGSGTSYGVRGEGPTGVYGSGTNYDFLAASGNSSYFSGQVCLGIVGSSCYVGAASAQLVLNNTNDGGIYIPATQTWINYNNAGNNYFGGTTYFRGTSGNPTGVTIDGQKGALAFNTVQAATITDGGTLTPTATRIEVTCSSIAYVTLNSGSLPVGTVIYVTQTNSSSYATINGKSLQGGVGATFIKTSDAGWVCVGYGM